ncbi:helix-turn-helix domain-containing protein [Leuconostoc pseudomesenteroides]|uniref:AraC family transcriptional regulator n=1 Tax=Leuconostoc pseudomesenteroides TaxID=33968 RepID=A0ABT6HDY8_LEUPS|nr:AraC family transcriptional regulator [Leuconostoc pseudomesenteroides]MDG9734287.1 AraC family transcriptional regulator [Leuconostoc pseudomesenteroides]NKZ36886.1 helix-turn-helix transcriptional regulator [Leuconostoc pseudomesenteroides]QQB27759.1 helix-turn-helix transcriptional regulator [Leuconostoc pseudomesenteroides]
MSTPSVVTKNIENLAKLSNADMFFLDGSKHNSKILYKNNHNVDRYIQTLLLSKLDLLLSHSYTSLYYDLGHVLACKINSTQLICLSFLHQVSITNSNQIPISSSIQHLKTLAQIIFSTYNSVEAPEAEVYIINISSLKHFKPTHLLQIDSGLFYDTETEIIKAIVFSNKLQLINALSTLSSFNIVGEHLMTNNVIRGEKNTLISYVSIFNRAIIQWGYPAKLAFKLQYDLVQEIELTLKFSNLSQAITKIAWHYFNIFKQHRVNSFLPLPQRVKNYIKQHIQENITLDDIATDLNASKKTLNPAFKTAYGVTIIQFVRHVKIEYAKELLLSSNFSILEISELLSFSTATYFVKTFKKVAGVTPNQFRKSHSSKLLKKII